MRDSLEREQRLDEVVAAYLEAVETGQAPDRDTLLRQHPDLADELAGFLADERQFDALMAPLRPSDQEATLRLSCTPAPSSRSDASFPGRGFGDYELLEEIARGGMGVVYKAHQKSLNRVVALKMILGGRLASAADVQRFRLEAEATAHLDHPNIVPIYEVGEWRSDDGTPLPFFSMKLIEGGSLAEHGGRFVTRPREAVRLMIQVARAIDHAHQRGILHRDLKPANVLLALASGRDAVDSRPEAGAKCVPYVTDFGLAKRVGSTGALTQTGTTVGTPSYMAPEQAAGLTLTTAADVYSLGAILYELLTGRPPFKAEVPLETLLQVLEREPLPPRSLNPRISRDLGTILLKCLDKAPERRYPSAAALADDLQRCLDGEPIQARPAGQLERFARWGRRNPALAVTSFVTALALLGVTAVSVVLYLRESQHAARLAGAAAALQAETVQTQAALAALQEEKQQTQKALAQAERHARESAESFRDAHQAVNDFVVRISDEMSKAPSLQPLRKEMLTSALQYYQRFLATRGDDPELRADLAHAYFQAGHITSSVGSKAEALKLYQKALPLYQEMARAHPGDPTYESNVGHTLGNISILQSALGQRAAALDSDRQAHEIAERLARTQPANPARLGDLAGSHHRLAVHLWDEGETTEALVHYDAARTLWEQLACVHQRGSRFQGELALCVNNSGVALSQLGRDAEARRCFETALAVREKLAAETPYSPNAQLGIAASLRDLGQSHDHLGQLEEARRYYERAFTLREQLARDYPSFSQYQADLAGSLNDLGSVHREQKQLSKAFDCHKRALAILQRLTDLDPDVMPYQNSLAKGHVSIGHVLADNGQREDAVRAFRRAREIQQRVVNADPGRLDWHSDLAWTLQNLGKALAGLERFDEAVAILREAVAEQRGAVDRAPQVARYRGALGSHLIALGEVCRSAGRASDAARAARERLKLWPGQPQELYRAAADLAAAADVISRGRLALDEAERAERQQYLDEALEALRQAVAAGFRDRNRLEHDPQLAGLRTHQDFAALVRKIP